MNSLNCRRVCRCLILYGLVTASSIAKPLFAAITVQTSDGRVITGEVDEKTDGQLLWIRQEQDRILLTVSLPWSVIISATDHVTTLPLDQLPELLRPQATAEPVGFLVQQVIYHATTDCQGDCLPNQPARRYAQRSTARVRSLDVEAFLVNLDRDVEPDGIEILVAALDRHGVPVPVKGNLSVRLTGERIHPHGSLVRYEDLQRWNQAVKPVDFVDGVASYALRFRTVRPEFDLGLHSTALLSVRLGVFGEGNFAASVPVQIRSFNPFRDRLQLKSGGRFLPDELTDEVRHQLPYRTNTLQRSWAR